MYDDNFAYTVMNTYNFYAEHLKLMSYVIN